METLAVPLRLVAEIVAVLVALLLVAKASNRLPLAATSAPLTLPPITVRTSGSAVEPVSGSSGAYAGSRSEAVTVPAPDCELATANAASVDSVPRSELATPVV